MSDDRINQDKFIAGMAGVTGNEASLKAAIDKVTALSFWSEPVTPEPLTGGASNINLQVTDQGRKYAVRVSEDDVTTGVFRANEVRALTAAGRAGVGPTVHYHEPGVIVADFIEGRALKPDDLKDERRLRHIANTLRQAHYEIPRHLMGPDFCLWPPHHCRWYLKASTVDSDRRAPERFGRVDQLLALTDHLEKLVGAVNVVFGHNDMMPQNVMETADGILLVDWEYAGFGPDLFDLGGLMMNTEAEEDLMRLLLSEYYGQPVDERLWCRFLAMMVLAAIRECAWSMLMETRQLDIDFDYAGYSTMCLQRIDRLMDCHQPDLAGRMP